MRQHITLFLIFIFVGCAAPSHPIHSSSKSKIIEETSPKEVPQNNLPKWILEPNIDGYICAVGSAKKQVDGDVSTQKKIALITAKANISKQIEIYIESELTMNKKCSASECQSDMNFKSRQQSMNMIRNIQIKNEWVDPNDKTMYLLVATQVNK